MKKYRLVFNVIEDHNMWTCLEDMSLSWEEIKEDQVDGTSK